MENIVESLFGLSPWQVQQQQNAGMDAYASNQASKSLLQRSSENYGRAGGMFAQAGAEAMGMVNPQVEQAKQRQAMLGGLEPNAESIRQRALQISDPKLKFQLLAYANQLDEKEQAKKLAAAQLKNAIDPSAKPARKDFTAESWKVYERTGKQSDLVEAAVESKQTNDIQEYEYAKKNGYTGSFAQWMTRNAKMKSGSVDGDSPPQSMLQKDQRWVKKDGQWVAEIIPGTKTDQKLKGDFATDQDAYNTLVDTTKTGKAKIAAILSPENEKGFKGMFGGYNAKYGTQYMSGNTAAVKQKLETLKSELKAAGLAIMRSGGGVGQITEKEWAIMEKLIDSVDPLMDEKDARNVLKSISEQLDTALIKGKRKFETEWADSRYAKPKSSASVSDW